MMKYVLLGCAMTMSAPLLAQQAQTVPQTVPAQPATPATDSATSAPTDATVGTAPQAATDAAAAPAETAAQPTASGDQVAQVVDSEFPTYDKDSNGTLSKTEFASWMGKLKASDPAAPTKAADAKKWNNAAFAQADTDKSNSVSKEELTGFLSAGNKAS